MSKPPKRRPRAKRPAAPRRTTRASSASKVRTADDDDQADDDDDDDDNELAADEALSLFFKRPPVGADHVVVVALSHAGEQIVQDRPAAEARRAFVQLANATARACERWAHSEGRECRFRASWQSGDRVLATHQWRAGQGDPQALNGTVESFLTQVQRHLEARESMSHERHIETREVAQTQQKAWETIVSAQDRRIAALEKDNADLRERLRRVDDVGSEIALEQAKADLEARGRTADILEKRVLPIVQAIVAQQIQRGLAADGGNSSSNAAALGSEHKQ